MKIHCFVFTTNRYLFLLFKYILNAVSFLCYCVKCWFFLLLLSTLSNKNRKLHVNIDLTGFRWNVNYWVKDTTHNLHQVTSQYWFSGRFDLWRIVGIFGLLQYLYQNTVTFICPRLILYLVIGLYISTKSGVVIFAISFRHVFFSLY